VVEPVTTALWVAKDLENDGRLGSFLVRSRSEGRSYREIAEELSEAGMPVSKSTVAKWCLTLGS